ncbi:MAG: DUF1641 domain-containing protein [Chloroflexota bacterium]
MDKDLALIHEKIDYLTTQVEAQHRRQEEMEELMQDAIPIVNHMIKLSIDELAEIGSDFQLEDLFFLLKRVLRDTHMLIGLLDQLESLSELSGELNLMGKRIFHQAVEKLDHMERAGYFDFARSGVYVADRMVEEFDPQAVRNIGENLIAALKTEPPEKVSLADLLRAMSDPQVRRGLMRGLTLLKVMGA